MFGYFVISTLICHQKSLVNLHVNSLTEHRAAALMTDQVFEELEIRNIYMIFHFPVT